MTNSQNASAWSRSNVLKFFETNRKKETDIYPSEWHFLEELLREGLDVLDIGCAQGGFASIFQEHLRKFTYTGLDISSEMIRIARTNHPNHQFHVVDERDFSILKGKEYDLVLVLGVLHLHENWRQTLKNAWQHTKYNLVFDLREIDQQTIEDKTVSYLKMDFGENVEGSEIETLPYNVINSTEVKKLISKICPEATKIDNYGYFHPVTSSAVTPLTEVLCRSWCISR